MKDAASYPDPFAAGGATCALTCTLTQGPCWAPTAPVRQDVSEGEAGVPVRLALRVVEADGCTPVAGAEVEIWHCNIDGLYSAKDVQSLSFCTANDAKAIASYFFRGRAITDADGKLTFDTCYPGWYPSRAIHIHFAVRRAAHAGENTTTNAQVISQLFFPEELTEEIFSTVTGYKEKGQPDTTFASDSVIGSVSDRAPYVAEYSRMTDGAMLAWKTIAISDSDTCGTSGGGPGGPPPG
jgi:protocatechuate 3,4-dioxygenase beta subunit